jgi:hypothetical protein
LCWPSFLQATTSGEHGDRTHLLAQKPHDTDKISSFHRKPADFIAMKSARNLELDRFTSLAHAIEDFQSLSLKS